MVTEPRTRVHIISYGSLCGCRRTHQNQLTTANNVQDKAD